MAGQPLKVMQAVVPLGPERIGLGLSVCKERTLIYLNSSAALA